MTSGRWPNLRLTDHDRLCSDALTIGSLFSGIGGLELGIEPALGARTLWQCERDPHASKVLAARFPGLPNYGDVAATDWASVPKVDIMCGGYPCQPFSTAGQRKGTSDDRHLWPAFRDAIRDVGPSLVVLENVRGHLTLGFGDVVADLAGLGFDAEWGVFRSSDIGAPHQRARLFVVAYRPGVRYEWSGPPWEWWPGPSDGRGRPASDPASTGLQRRDPRSGASEPQHGPSQRYRNLDIGGSKPITANPDSSNGLTVDHVTGTSIGGLSTRELAHRRGSDSERNENRQRTWGKHWPAIQRWEQITGRPAPNPVDNRNRLTPELPEWMMGFPDGWVTALDQPRTQKLKQLGNAVQPQSSHNATVQLVGRIAKW